MINLCLTKINTIMKKFYFFLLMFTITSLISNAQLVKHYTAEDEAVNSWWVNNSAISYWELTSCDGVDGVYPLFIADLSLLGDDETFGAWNWATDLKIDTSMSANALEIIADAQSKLFINFWLSAFDGVNANDSLGFSFELLAPDKLGWPGITIEPVGSEWKWVSIDLSGLDFSGSVAGDLGEIAMVKFALQPTIAYTKQEGFFKMGIQDITVSKGAAAQPATAPCSEQTGIKNLKASELKFYPNPAQNEISFNEAKTGEIVNIAGKQVIEFNNTQRVNIQSLKAGIYFVKSGTDFSKLIVE